MAINGIGYGSTVLGQSVRNLNDQLTTLSAQLTTGKKATTYAGMGVNEGFAIAARGQLSNISAFTDTMTKITTTINVADTALQALVNIGAQVQNAASASSQALNGAGQTIAQQNAASQLGSMLGILNTQSGDRYVFSGGAIDTPAVTDADTLLSGSGAQAGLKQVIAERNQADLGGGLGRLVLSAPATTPITLREDVSPSAFGLKLNSVSSSLTGATVTGPTGSPPTVSIALGANPNGGDQISLKFNLPDGSTETVQLTASSAVPTPAGSFAIGATPAATSANLNAALNGAIGTLANTSLVAASAVAAAADFFADPPQRVAGAPLATATALTNGTAANTVSWYSGENGAGPARASSIARIDQSITVQYGARATEQGIRNQLQSVAVLAAVASTGPNAAAQVAALSQRVTHNLTAQPGQQTIQDIQADLSIAQNTMKDATARQKQTQAMLQNIVDGAESVAPEQVASQILALQNALQASYQTTAMLSQLSLTKFLPI
ncbi:flagellar biosynthesis protein FlgL [Bradyrhizobium sp.]|jgi:flagellin-like hook-associated protein FlgL|uniref:flagellar biosynthesis protein FlgL n=1 Tax=Bradyrhizobium sp. TaxID=376 RepID=UPI002E035A1B|nr:flagellar biosynthesis protein FlgL [Bradyrhizobium sp.]